MSALSKAARHWLNSDTASDGGAVSVVTIGVAAGRRTAVAHYVADAAEVTVDGETTLAARWLCGGSSVDAAVIGEDAVDCVNCRLAAALPSGPVVYYAWGEDDELLYVGSTINAAQRIRGHASATPWWPKVRRLTFDSHPTEVAVRRAELVAINARPGTYNREGRPGRLWQDDALLRLVEGDGAS